MVKSKLRIKGEIVAYIILLVISLWFFLINVNIYEVGETVSYELTTHSIVSGIIFFLSAIWGIVNLIRYKKFSE